MNRPKLVTFSFEEKITMKLYDEMPVRIIKDFLQCVDSDGNQAFEFPPHVVRALSERFRDVVGPDRALNSLDEAFGGRIARQRNALEQDDKDWERNFDYFMARDEACTTDRRLRSGTPSEIAAEEAASRHRVSEDTVKRSYKRSARRSS